MPTKKFAPFAGTGKGDWAPDQGGGKVQVSSKDGTLRYEGYMTNLFTTKQRAEMRKKGTKAPLLVAKAIADKNTPDIYESHPGHSIASWDAIKHTESLRHEKDMFLLRHGLVRDPYNSPDGYKRVPLNWMHDKPAPRKKEKRTLAQRILYIFGF